MNQVSIAGNTENYPSETAPTEISNELNTLHACHDELLIAVNSLEERLRSVLRTSQPETDAAPDLKAGAPLVPLANELRGSNQSVSNAVRQLRDIKNRIELPN